jgi:hypothetical protein
MAPVLLLCTLLVAACSSEGGSGAPVDAGSVVDQSASVDLSGSVDLAVPSGGKDQGAAPDLRMAADLSPSKDLSPSGDLRLPQDLLPLSDGGVPDGGFAADRGQCYLNSHCGAGQSCTANAPGGICTCGSPTDCPAQNDDECFAGACVRGCSATSQCVEGMVCKTGVSRCALITPCSKPTDCSPLHVCRAFGSGFACQRPLCPGGGPCPQGTTCRMTSAGELCVENHLTF